MGRLTMSKKSDTGPHDLEEKVYRPTMSKWADTRLLKQKEEVYVPVPRSHCGQRIGLLGSGGCGECVRVHWYSMGTQSDGAPTSGPPQGAVLRRAPRGRRRRHHKLVPGRIWHQSITRWHSTP